MIVSFRDAPIRKKFVAIILLTSGLVLAGSSIVFVVNEALSFRTDARKALESAATKIGRNSVAAVKARDAIVANELLQELRGNESPLPDRGHDGTIDVRPEGSEHDHGAHHALTVDDRFHDDDASDR